MFKPRQLDVIEGLDIAPGAPAHVSFQGPVLDDFFCLELTICGGPLAGGMSDHPDRCICVPKAGLRRMSSRWSERLGDRREGSKQLPERKVLVR